MRIGGAPWHLGFLLLLSFVESFALNQLIAIKPVDKQTYLISCFLHPEFSARELETNKLLMLIGQYDLRNSLALSEKFSLAFPSYLKEEGKGLVLRMVGCWSQEVLSVR